VNEPDLPVPSPIELARRLAALTGLLGLALASAGWVFRPDAFWHAYLFAWLLWASATLGCALVTILVRILQWGPAVRPVLHAGTRTTPLVAVLVLPLVLQGTAPAGGVLAAATAQPAAALLRLALTGPALAALALTLATLAALARSEPAVLTAVVQRTLRFSLSALLATDAAATLALCHRVRATAIALAVIEIGVAGYLASRSRARHLLVAGTVAFLAHAVLLRRLLPAPALLPGDPKWTPAMLDLLLAGAIGGLWLALFFWRLDRDPPPPFKPVVAVGSSGSGSEGARAEKLAGP